MSQYPSNRSTRPASSTQPGIARSSSRRSQASGGYSGQRPTSGRPSGQRTAASGRSPARRGAPQGSRQPSRGGQPGRGGRRRPPRRRAQGRFYVFLAIVAVLVIGIVFFAVRSGHKDRQIVTPNTPATPNVTASQGNASDVAAASSLSQNDPTSQYASISQMLSSNEGQVGSLSADQMVQVSDLSVKQGLPEEWLNVLLLGTDERKLSDGARTDAILICSINRKTGEVKLTSIMRDLAVEFNNLGKLNGTYGINAANYFGGPKLAMKTVNELFDMNIQNYVMVNFFGFQRIAERLGGIDVDLSEDEMKLINERVVEQYKFAKKAGIDESDIENAFVETYGPNTHLNGRATLAYARIRKTDGGDYRRTERQQIVLTKLAAKVKQLGATQIMLLGAEMMDQVKTNMSPDDILNIALVVAQNGVSDFKTFRLPINNSYKEETRDEKSLLWDCDFAANAVKLYDFIYV